MLTIEELAAELRTVNVAEVARRAGVAEKTIYRLRHGANAPRLDTVQAILRAIADIELDKAQAGQVTQKHKKAA